MEPAGQGASLRKFGPLFALLVVAVVVVIVVVTGGDDGNMILGDTYDFSGPGLIDIEAMKQGRFHSRYGVLSGGKGDDEIIGGAGNDFLIGGDGDDCIQGGNGHNFAFGDAFDVTPLQPSWEWTSGFTPSVFSAFTGVVDILQLLTGVSLKGSGNDEFLGGDSVDVAFGGEGNDVLIGAGGSNLLVGNAGNDSAPPGAGTNYVFEAVEGAVRTRCFDLGTIRGKKFSNSSCHSIVSKKNARDRRLSKTYPPKLSNFAISFVDKTLINQ